MMSAATSANGYPDGLLLCLRGHSRRQSSTSLSHPAVRQSAHQVVTDHPVRSTSSPTDPGMILLLGILLHIIAAGPTVVSGAESASVPVYSVSELRFSGPHQTEQDCPSRDVHLQATFRHLATATELTVHGFFDGDGHGSNTGNVFVIRFCPTLPGTWRIVSVRSTAAELNGQHEGLTLTATDSTLHGFWIPDRSSSGGRWYRRSDGSHQYIIGNTHYTFLSEHGRDGQPTGSSIAADVTANANFFRKLRFGLQGGRYPHPTEQPWLNDSGQPTADGNFSHRPAPAWFHRRVDLAVQTAFAYDLIADLILAGPDTPDSRTTLKARHNSGDATAYLRYIAARYGSYPNVWLCLCNEYDIKTPAYAQSEIADRGVMLRRFLPYPTPLSVHDGSQIGWAAEFDTLPEWADHQIIQRKLRSIAPSADAVSAVWRGQDGSSPRQRPTINDELSYQGAGDRHDESDTIAAHLGAFLGGGYGSTGEKHGTKLGQYFWGAFDAREHTSAERLRWLRETIDRDIQFWKLAPQQNSPVFPGLPEQFRVLAAPGEEYVVGSDLSANGLIAELPPGEWNIIRHDVMAGQTMVLASGISGRYIFSTPESRAVLFHFRRLQP